MANSHHRFALLPSTASRNAFLLLTSRALRAFGDGLISLVLPYYLIGLGFDALAIGLITAADSSGQRPFQARSISRPSTREIDFSRSNRAMISSAGECPLSIRFWKCISDWQSNPKGSSVFGALATISCARSRAVSA